MPKSPSPIAKRLRSNTGAFLWVLGAFVFGSGCTPASARPAPVCGQFDGNYRAYAKVLSQYVDEAGRVDYRGLSQKGAEALRQAEEGLASMCRADYQKMSDHDQMAFWINAYNLYTLIQIDRHFPLPSIRKIGFLPGAAWLDHFIDLPGMRTELFSLNEVEHDILRKEFNDPRIHFAINCASVGCPTLRNQPFTGATLNQDLEQAARDFMSDQSKNRVRDDGAAELSRIFKWFGSDFEKGGQTLPARIAPWATGGLRQALLKPSVKIEFATYDWALNAQPQ